MHTIALCCAIFELSCAIYVYLHNRYNREYMTTVKAFIRTGKKDKEVNVRFRLSDGRNVQLFHKVTTKKRNAERYSDRIELQGF